MSEGETEILTETQKLNEYIMISLRTIEGLDLEKINKSWGNEKARAIEYESQNFKQLNLVSIEDNKVQLTNEGMLRADGIAADLFFP